MTVFGSTTRGIKAELTVTHAHGSELWTLYGLTDDGEITFEHEDGMPSCTGHLADGQLLGQCWVSEDSGPLQLLVVRP